MAGLGPARIGTLYTKDQCRLATSEIRYLGVQWDKRKRFLPFYLLAASVVLVQLELSSSFACRNITQKIHAWFLRNPVLFSILLFFVSNLSWSYLTFRAGTRKINQLAQSKHTKSKHILWVFFYTVETVHHSEIRCLVITYLFF